MTSPRGRSGGRGHAWRPHRVSVLLAALGPRALSKARALTGWVHRYSKGLLHKGGHHHPLLTPREVLIINSWLLGLVLKLATTYTR